jgi:hypothetical protein
MSERINLQEVLPEIPRMAFMEAYFEAIEKLTKSVPLEEKYPDLPDGISDYFVQVYPEKYLEGDESLLVALSGLVKRLEDRKGEPVLLVNEHGKQSAGHGNWRVISFGFSSRRSTNKERLEASPSYYDMTSGHIGPKLFAPQSLSHHDDIGVSFATSFGVQRWDVDHLPMVGLLANIVRRDPVYETFKPGDNTWNVKDTYGDIAIGNAEVEEYVAENLQLADVIDGCREAYSNDGSNPEIGRAIARAFGKDKELTDEQQRKLQWL